MDTAALLHDPVTWVACAFIIFMAGFLKLAVPVIVRGLDSKSAAIARELDEAKRLRAEAEALLAEYKQKQTAMMAEAEALLAHAQKEAITMKADAEQTLKAAIERRSKQAQESISRAEAEAIRTLRANLVEVATSAAKAAIAAQIESQSGDALIEHALKDIGKIVH